jgi:hypothetical protein
MYKAEKLVQVILQVFGEIETEYEEHCRKLEELNGERRDLEHEMEFSKCDIQQGYQLYQNYHFVSKERRSRMVEKELLFPLWEIVSKDPRIKQSFIKAAEQIRRKSREIQTRTYQPEIRTDLPAINSGRTFEVIEIK